MVLWLSCNMKLFLIHGKLKIFHLKINHLYMPKIKKAHLDTEESRLQFNWQIRP